MGDTELFIAIFVGTLRMMVQGNYFTGHHFSCMAFPSGDSITFVVIPPVILNAVILLSEG